MVVILGDGTVVADDDPRARLRRARQHLPDSRLKYALLAVALAAAYSFVNAPASEAAGGKVPAMSRAPKDHWLHIYYSPFLVRDLSRSSAHQDHSVFGRVSTCSARGWARTRSWIVRAARSISAAPTAPPSKRSTSRTRTPSPTVHKSNGVADLPPLDSVDTLVCIEN